MWIARVPRENWNPKENANIFLCERHFMPSDIINGSMDSNSRRKKNKTSKLYQNRIKEDALPCIWPDLPAHLTKVITPRPTSFSSSGSRRENAKRLFEEVEQDRISQDTFSSLEELILKEAQLVFPSDLYKVVSDSYIIFYKLDVNADIPMLIYSVKVHSDLSINLHFENEKISYSHISGIKECEMNTCTSLNTIFSYLESIPKKQVSDDELVDEIIHKLEYSSFSENKKVGFLIEQLILLLKKPNARRYSLSMLAMTVLIQRISPACYKQLYNDGFLTRPSPGHLRRLCSSIDVDSMTLNESAIAYITARFKRLPEKDRLVSVLLDEVYSHQAVQYDNGKFFGAEGGQMTKTMLCVMLKSIAGKYRDIVVMVPVVNINAEKLHSIWTDIMIKIEKIGFDVAVTMTDGHSSNMNFFINKLLKSKSNLFVLMDSGAKNFPFYDNTHIFKNFYNNWSNYDSFECPFPNIENTHKIISPTFSHLKELYLLEKGRNKKFAYKLTDKVLHPKPIEKTNVKLVDAAFHESTINALRYYSS